MPRLQLVFWLGAIPGIVTLLIVVIAGNFKDVPFRALTIPMVLFLALVTYSRSGINPSGSVFRLFASSLAILLLFFFPGILRELFGFGVLLGLIDFIFGLRGLFVSLFVPEIDIYLQRSFFWGTIDLSGYFLKSWP